jgi:hypothetical protein
MNINKMTRKQFNELRPRDWNEDIGELDSVVILPLRSMHDSGYRKMDFVGVVGDEPVCRLSGCSDVVNVGGIIWGSDKTQRWSIDCLAVSGLLRIFSNQKILVGPALSSFDIFQK